MIRHTRPAPARGGYVIFAVLIVVVVLSLVAYRFTEAMTAEYRVGARAGDDAQAKLAAVSGLHYAAAVLSDRDTFSGELNGDPFDNPDVFERVEVPAGGDSGSATRKTPLFDIRCVALTAGGGYEPRFGVIDEGGKLNVNALFAIDPTGEALYNGLQKLPNMTPEIAAAIVDWVDPDDDKQREGGAESAEYAGLANPYKAKNGPLNSLDELLLVQGVTPELLYGGDRNRNGSYDDGDTGTDRGWSDYLTVYGRELNVASDGQVRTFLNGDDLAALRSQLTPQLGDELTLYILAAKLFAVTQTDESGNPRTTGTTRSTSTASSGGGSAAGGTGSTRTTTTTTTATGGQRQGQSQRETRAATLDELQAAVETKLASTFTGGNRVRSLADLMYSRIALPRPQGAQAEDPDLIAFSPLLDAGKRNTLLATLMDRTTTTSKVELDPRINVNTAPREVLLAVPGVTEEMADAILTARDGVAPSDPAYPSAAWLLTSAGIPPATYKALEKYVTGSTMVYRVQSVGYFAEGGPVARMEAVIDTNQGAPRFLMVRDLADLDNPRGFDPARTTNP